VFVGRAIAITSSADAHTRLQDLRETDKRIAKASHPHICAWRVSDPATGAIVDQEYDDNGEPPGGERILALLEMVGVANVLVVVTRWYGGTQLGSDRFKHISSAAQRALEKGGFFEKKRGKKDKNLQQQTGLSSSSSGSKKKKGKRK
jgi:putative IMPACT (imprinted ancient) family translation regulator